MTTMKSYAPVSGQLGISVIRAGNPPEEKAPLSWKIKNNTRPAFINGYLGAKAAGFVTKHFPVTAITSELALRKWDTSRGVWINYGIVGRKVVTSLAAELFVDQLHGAFSLSNVFIQHALGSGSAAEGVANTALTTEFTTQYLTDNTRVAGTATEQAASPQVYETVATITVDATAIAREHAILNWTTSGGSMLDRTVFAEVNMAASDAIQATYRLTIQAGG